MQLMEFLMELTESNVNFLRLINDLMLMPLVPGWLRDKKTVPVVLTPRDETRYRTQIS
jgi:hypothetical protein